MDLSIRRAHDTDVDALVELTLLAFVPVFDSFRNVLGPAIYTRIWPDWRASQREAVEAFCRDPGNRSVLVAEMDGTVVGLIVYQLQAAGSTAEVVFLAVHPEYQNRGIGTRLNERALEEMRLAGAKLAVVETGGECSHAPARRTYEKAGYIALPLVRYFKEL